MASKNHKKNPNKQLYIAIGIVAFLILLAILLQTSAKKKNTEFENEEPTPEELQSMEQASIDSTLQDMEERDRMEYYFGMFLHYIEDEEYEKAYDLLYPEFKENYFPTLDKFTEYVQNTFSDMMDIEHENIERNGDVYVLWINIADALNGKPGEKKQMNVVIKENDYNDFVMSFSVK